MNYKAADLAKKARRLWNFEVSLGFFFSKNLDFSFDINFGVEILKCPKIPQDPQFIVSV